MQNGKVLLRAKSNSEGNRHKKRTQVVGSTYVHDGRGYRNRTYTKGVRGPCATTTPIPTDEGIIIHYFSKDKLLEETQLKKIKNM